MKKIFLLYCFISMLSCQQNPADNEIRVLQFNVWKEGIMVKGGFAAIVDAILQSEADIISLNEIHIDSNTDLGFSQKLATELTKMNRPYYTFKSDQNGILSKFPIIEEKALSGGKKDIHKALIKTPVGLLVFYSVHLDSWHYAPLYPRGYETERSLTKMNKPILDTAAILKETRKSERLQAMNIVIEDAHQYIKQGRNVIIAGDFNEPSHRDWIDATKDMFDHRGVVITWPTTKLLEDNGYIDAYRQLFPNPATHPGITWPANNTAAAISDIAYAPESDERDRIDYIFYKTPQKNLLLKNIALFGPPGSIVRNERQDNDSQDILIKPHQTWPSDHMAVLATFIIETR